MVGFHLQYITKKKNRDVYGHVPSDSEDGSSCKGAGSKFVVLGVLNLEPHYIFHAFFCFCTVFGSIYVATGL